MRKYKLLCVIGDSISQGYCPHLVTSLRDAYVVLQAPGNSRSSANIANNLDDWLAGHAPDAVELNCGLHDIMREEDQPATPAHQYEANLRDIVARLQGLAGPPRLIWARTTPVIDERHQTVQPFGRENEDVIAYNEIADVVTAEMGVESIDLYGVVVENDPQALLTADGVHFTLEGYQVLAQTITDYLLEQ